MRTGPGSGEVAEEKKLRLLLVEDREDDAFLLQLHLEDAGYRLELLRVESLDAVQAALPAGWDLVISDYNLPGFTALEALALVRASGEEMPFLVMSGQVSEDVAVAAMRAGAQDYVSKQNLARLVPAIERSLRERSIRAERRQATEALRSSEERLRLAQAAGQLVAWDWDLTTGTVAWSGPCELVYGVPAAELGTSEVVMGRMHDRDRQAVNEETARSLEQRRDFAAEFRVCWPDGSTHWVSSYGRAQYGDDGAPLRMLGINQNITQRKQAEEARQRLAAIVESAEDAIISKSLDGIIESWNAAAEQMFGYSSEEAVGQPMALIVPADLMGEEREILARLRRGERLEHFETYRCTRDGEKLPVSLTISPIRDMNGTVIGVSTVARNISRQKQAEAALRRNEKLAAAGRLAASISHEINNPLESVTNLLYLATQAQELDTETREYLMLAQRELGRVSHIATHTLRFHRQSTGPQAVDLSSILHSILALHEGRLRTLQVEVRERIQPVRGVIAFEGELRQVLANLVGNAVDALVGSPVRKLYLRVASRTAADGRQTVRILIADSGVGMDKAVQKRLFEPFFSTKGMNGTGLGLWISREILERHQGRIRLRSQPGAGTVFAIDLPVGLTPRPQADAETRGRELMQASRAAEEQDAPAGSSAAASRLLSGGAQSGVGSGDGGVLEAGVPDAEEPALMR